MASERQAEPDQVVSRVADHRLIQSRIWTNTCFDSATGPRLPTWQSPQIHTGGPSGNATACTLEPIVKFDGAAANIGVCRRAILRLRFWLSDFRRSRGAIIFYLRVLQIRIRH